MIRYFYVDDISQKEEISTIKKRNIELNLSDNDCKRVLMLCEQNGMTPAELLQMFIGDLVDGTYSSGSDERMLANQYFERHFPELIRKDTLVNYCIDTGVDYGNIFYCLNVIENSPKEIEEEKNNIINASELYKEFVDTNGVQSYANKEEYIKMCKECINDIEAELRESKKKLEELKDEYNNYCNGELDFDEQIEYLKKYAQKWEECDLNL